MFFANDLKQTIEKHNIDNVIESYIENLYNIVQKYISDKAMFSMDNFSIHIYDEYVLGTNCHNDIFVNIYLEINQPLNYKISTKSKTKNNRKIEIPELYLSLSNIRNGLIETFSRHYDNSNIVWMDKYGICQKATVPTEIGYNIDYYFRLIPCLTYYNKNNVKGVMYYSNGDIEIDYPDLAVKNFKKKNKQTKDQYRQMILIFKNIIQKETKSNNLPSELIETLLYNVPNKLFISDNKNDILNIINFIRNNPLKEFKTIDEEDYAFSSIYKSMSMYYSKHIMKIIEKYITSR